MRRREEALLIRCPGCFQDRGYEPVCPYCGYREDLDRSPLYIAPGTTLSDRFIVGQILGKPGPLCITYLCWDTIRETCVAIKEFFPRLLAARAPDSATVTLMTDQEADLFDEGLVGFLHEARHLIGINHPNKITVQGFFEANDTGYVVLDYASGRSLDEYLGEGTRLDAKTAVSIIAPILDALECLHENELLHCDINPQSIFLTEGESGTVRPLLMDSLAVGAATNMRQENVSVSIKRGYAPIELYQAESEIGPWSDIYSLSATLYRMLTGITPQDALSRLLRDKVDAPSKLNIKLLPRHEVAIMQGLHTRPEQRIPSVDEFRRLWIGREEKLDPITFPLPILRGFSPPSIPEVPKKIFEVPRPIETDRRAKATIRPIPPELHLHSTFPPEGNFAPELPSQTNGKRQKANASTLFLSAAIVATLMLMVAGFLYGNRGETDSELDMLANLDTNTEPRISPSRVDTQRTSEIFRIADALVQEIERPEPPPLESPPDEVVTRNEPVIYERADVMPVPTGGMTSIQNALVYPDAASAQGISGIVKVHVIIDEQGTVNYASVQEGIGGGCDEEALRVVKQTRFRPGRIDGEPVKVRTSIPVTFTLPETQSRTQADKWVAKVLATAREDMAVATVESDRGQYQLADEMYRMILERIERFSSISSEHRRLDSIRSAVRNARSKNQEACEAEVNIAKNRGESPPACS